MATISINVEIPTDVLDDVFVSAFDAGYPWFTDYEITAHGYSIVHDPSCNGEENKHENLYLTREQFAQAIGKWLEWQFDFDAYTSALEDLDADAAVQKALFGEVVYG